MENEELLPLGEPTLHLNPPSTTGTVPAKSVPPLVPPSYLPPVMKVAERKAPTVEPPPNLPGVPSQKQQQWGVVISIIIIVLMIVVGAFYSWGKRIAEENALIAPAAATE